MSTRNLIQKKLISHFLASYASKCEDVSLLSIGTLHSDCTNSNPIIRGIALRTLSSLRSLPSLLLLLASWLFLIYFHMIRIASLLEYVLPPIAKGLVDEAPYVRKIAVIAAAKVNQINPEAIEEIGAVNKLYGMLRDPDPDVVATVINALNDILKEKGGIVVNRHIFQYLLSRFEEFNEWHRSVIIDSLKKLDGLSREEVFELLVIISVFSLSLLCVNLLCLTSAVMGNRTY